MRYFLIFLLSSTAWAQAVWPLNEHLKLVQQGKKLQVVLSGQKWPQGAPMLFGFRPPNGAFGKADFLLDNANHLAGLENWPDKIQDGMQGIESSLPQKKSLALKIWGQGAALIIEDIHAAQPGAFDSLTLEPRTTPVLASYYLSRNSFKVLTQTVYQAQDKLRR